MRAIALAIAAAASIATPQAPTHHVEDHAAFLSVARRDALDAELAGYERATGHQVVVWIDRTIGTAALDEWAAATFAAWKLGRAGHDDGLAIFVLTDDRAIDIEVGYGLEDRVPDAVAARTIREVMTPRLQAGDRDGAIAAGVETVLGAIEGKPWVGSADTSGGDARWPWAIVGALAVAAILLAIKYPRAALWLAATAARSAVRGGGGSGFHGGGGRSGGGGARGRW